LSLDLLAVRRWSSRHNNNNSWHLIAGSYWPDGSGLCLGRRTSTEWRRRALIVGFVFGVPAYLLIFRLCDGVIFALSVTHQALRCVCSFILISDVWSGIVTFEPCLPACFGRHAESSSRGFPRFKHRSSNSIIHHPSSIITSFLHEAAQMVDWNPSLILYDYNT